MTEKTVIPTYNVQRLDQVVGEHVAHALVIYGWNMTRTAAALNVDRRTLYRLVERHKIERPAELPAETHASCGGCGKEAPETDAPAEPGFIWFCSPDCAKPKNGGVARAT